MDTLEFIKLWNATWKSDYWWRQKYNVAFNSPQHRAMDPLDIQIDYLESKLAQEYSDQAAKENENEPLIKKGEWIRENENRSSAKKVWDKMDLSQF